MYLCVIIVCVLLPEKHRNLTDLEIDSCQRLAGPIKNKFKKFEGRALKTYKLREKVLTTTNLMNSKKHAGCERAAKLLDMFYCTKEYVTEMRNRDVSSATILLYGKFVVSGDKNKM